jgi:hypothetical protein
MLPGIGPIPTIWRCTGTTLIEISGGTEDVRADIYTQSEASLDMALFDRITVSLSDLIRGAMGPFIRVQAIARQLPNGAFDRVPNSPALGTAKSVEAVPLPSCIGPSSPVAPGATFAIDVVEFRPNERGYLVLGDRIVDEGLADAGGAMTLHPVLPADLHGGAHQVSIKAETTAATADCSIDTRSSNDDFANRIRLSSSPERVLSFTQFDSTEPAEPTPCNAAGGRSVWYEFTAPATAVYHASTFGSDFDTVLAVYSGTSLGALTLLDCSDNVSENRQSSLNFFGEVGTTYILQLAGYEAAGGSLLLNLHAVDTDGDGCSDVEESGTVADRGGDRSPAGFWDFFDVTWDARIDLGDTLVILEHFGHGPSDDAYDELLDRDAPDTERPYRTAESSGFEGIDLTDALVNLLSFGHDCSGPP